MSGETWEDHAIVCPHCGCRHEDELPGEFDGERFEFDCDSCELTFRVELDVTYSFKAHAPQLPCVHEFRSRKNLEQQFAHVVSADVARRHAWDPKRDMWCGR